MTTPASASSAAPTMASCIPRLHPLSNGSVGHPVFYRRTKGSVTESVARARSVGVPEAVMTLRAAALRSVCDSERACSS